MTLPVGPFCQLFVALSLRNGPIWAGLRATFVPLVAEMSTLVNLHSQLAHGGGLRQPTLSFELGCVCVCEGRVSQHAQRNEVSRVVAVVQV